MVNRAVKRSQADLSGRSIPIILTPLAIFFGAVTSRVTRQATAHSALHDFQVGRGRQRVEVRQVIRGQRAAHEQPRQGEIAVKGDCTLGGRAVV